MTMPHPFGSNPSDIALINEFQSHRDDFLAAYLRRAGLANLELRAHWERIPAPIKSAIPGHGGGFGLIGGYRVGKTSALAALTRREAEKAVDRHIERMAARPEEDFLLTEAIKKGRLSAKPHVSWINWSTVIPEYRAKLFVREAQGEVESWIQDHLLDGHITLILDDLGADRKTSQDWSGEVLARVIDERLRRELRTLWTSNCVPKELVHRYGGRTVSRLFELAPPVMLPNLPPFLGESVP